MSGRPSKHDDVDGLKDLVEYIARALVDHPDAVEVTQSSGHSAVVVELRVAPDDMGRVIGKSGRVANAIRALLRVAAARDGRRITLEIV
ncbi:MAG TPA: KH domain-containing protein [Aggregatilineales bacterium]|nr:KH domain-containing protein [Aggregatilineales bacterium]